MSFLYYQAQREWFTMYEMHPLPPKLNKGESPPYQDYILQYLRGDERGLLLFLHYYEQRIMNPRCISFIDNNNLPTCCLPDLKQEYAVMISEKLGEYSADREESFLLWLKRSYMRVFNEYYLRNHANAGGMDVKTFENYKANYAKWLANRRSGHPLTLDAFLAENCITERVWRNTLIAISFISLNVSVQKSAGDDEDELSQDELLTVSRENVDLLQEVQDEMDRAIGEYVPDRNETHHITDANEIFIIRAALAKSISELTPRQKRVFLKTIGFDEMEWRFDEDLELSMQELADTCTFPSANAASKYFNTVRQILIDKLTARGITANGVERKIEPVKIKETA